MLDVGSQDGLMPSRGSSYHGLMKMDGEMDGGIGWNWCFGFALTALTS